MKIKEQIVNQIREKPLTRKELIECLPSVNTNTLDVIIHQLKKKKIIKKKNKKYLYVNPFLKVFEIEDKTERELEMYKILLRLITPDAKHKALELMWEACII